MNKKNYRLKTLRFDQVWLPFSLWALFVIVGLIIHTPEKYYDLTRIYLSTVLPLVTGILSAYAILDDPTLELKFSTPLRMERLLFERLGLIFGIQLVFALLFQGYAAWVHADLVPLGNFWQLQLVWLIPCLAAMSLGCFMALIGATSIGGAVTIGFYWILQAILHSFFAANSYTKYFFWFMGGLNPGHSALQWNQLTLAALSVVLMIASIGLLRRQERYL